MDMTEDNDRTLAEFLGESAKMEMTDNGFSDGVMRRLDTAAAIHARRMQRVWTAMCCILGFALLIAVGPMAVGDISAWFAVAPRVLLSCLPHKVNPLLLLVPYAVAVCMAIYALVDRERLSDVRL